jgi:hypothetical protein
MFLEKFTLDCFSSAVDPALHLVVRQMIAFPGAGWRQSDYYTVGALAAESRMAAIARRKVRVNPEELVGCGRAISIPADLFGCRM